MPDLIFRFFNMKDLKLILNNTLKVYKLINYIDEKSCKQCGYWCYSKPSFY